MPLDACIGLTYVWRVGGLFCVTRTLAPSQEAVAAQTKADARAKAQVGSTSRLRNSSIAR